MNPPNRPKYWTKKHDQDRARAVISDVSYVLYNGDVGDVVESGSAAVMYALYLYVLRISFFGHWECVK